MRILIFGAGVIGSLYGALLAEAGYDVSIYARKRAGRGLDPAAHPADNYREKCRYSACCPCHLWDGYSALCFKAPSGIGSCTGIR